MLNVMCQPGWERGLGENGYMYMYDWVSLLFMWNDYKVANQLYSNTKYKVLKKKNKKSWKTYIPINPSDASIINILHICFISIYLLSFVEPIESKLQTSWHFPCEYLNLYLLQNKNITYRTISLSHLQKVNLNYC